MNNVHELTDSNFDQTVGSGVTLVDFWAPWCMPCKMQIPILEKVAKKVSGATRVAKVNVQKCPALASRFSIQSIPALLVFRDGKVVKQFTGMQQESTLFDALSTEETSNHEGQTFTCSFQ